MTLNRGASRKKYKANWFLEGDELDDFDYQILICIKEKPGINISQLRTCLPMTGLIVYYRINTLERAGYISTSKVRNERRCYLNEAKKPKQNLAHYPIWKRGRVNE